MTPMALQATYVEAQVAQKDLSQLVHGQLTVEQRQTQQE